MHHTAPEHLHIPYRVYSTYHTARHVLYIRTHSHPIHPTCHSSTPCPTPLLCALCFLLYAILHTSITCATHIDICPLCLVCTTHCIPHVLATHNPSHYTHHTPQVFPSSHASTHTQCIAHAPTPTLHATDSHNPLLTSYIPNPHTCTSHTTQCAHTAHPSESLLPHPKALRPEVLSGVLARRLCCLVREEHPFSNEDIAGVKGSRAVGRHSVLHAWQKLCVCLSVLWAILSPAMLPWIMTRADCHCPALLPSSVMCPYQGPQGTIISAPWHGPSH